MALQACVRAARPQKISARKVAGAGGRVGGPLGVASCDAGSEDPSQRLHEKVVWFPLHASPLGRGCMHACKPLGHEAPAAAPSHPSKL